MWKASWRCEGSSRTDECRNRHQPWTGPQSDSASIEEGQFRISSKKNKQRVHLQPQNLRPTVIPNSAF